MPYLTARNLDVHLAGKRILEAVDFEFETGTWTGILGPNGSGENYSFEDCRWFLGVPRRFATAPTFNPILVLARHGTAASLCAPVALDVFRLPSQ